MIATQIIADFSLFPELTNGERLDPDEAVEMTELLGKRLVELDKPFLRELVDAFAVIAPEYSGEAERLVRNIPFDFYLEERLAADDPEMLARLEALREAAES